MIRPLSLFLSAVLCLAATAAWPQAKTSGLSEQDRQVVERVQSYLDGIKTVKAEFLQVASNGQTAEGELWIKRPGKMRVEYGPPVEDLLVATGIYLIRYDAEMQQSTYLPLGSSPASVLLDERLDLDEHVDVLQVQRTENLIHVEVRQKDAPESGSIFLSFTKDPLRLAEWTVINGNGQSTNVRLIDPEFNVELEDDLFYYMEPTPGWDPNKPRSAGPL